jgi:ABC-type branched-subunit amino acid transport system ATPase component
MAVRMDVHSRSIVLQPADGMALVIRLDHGGSYHLTCPHASEVESLVAELELVQGVAILPQDGGMLGRMTVAENLSLALGYGRPAEESSQAEYEADLRTALRLCGVSEERMVTVGGEKPIAMDTVDRWMIGLVRNILVPPELLVIDRVYAGLSRIQANAVAGIEAVFRKYHPFRPVLWLDVESHVSHSPQPEQAEHEEATCLS